MKNSSFSLSFASTLALVLLSTIVLAGCASQTNTSAVPEEGTSAVESQTASPAPLTETSEITLAEQPSEPQVLTFTPSYISPGGEESIDIMLTLANGIVTEAEATSRAKHPTSQQMQAGFVEAFSGAVLGKSLSELENIDRIGGASLTTGAFRKALTELNQT